MSSVNWPEVITIFIGFGAFFIYLMSRLDSFKKELNDKIDASNKNLNDKIEALQQDINRVDSKVSNIEGQITQMTRPNIVPIDQKQSGSPNDHPKEN